MCFIAGGEFGDREGHTLIIVKALYGLKSSGLRWHQRFSKVLRDMGFIPSRAERDIWMRDCGDHYEHIATYVDDLIIGSKDPEAIVNTLTSPKYGFKLKGTGDVSYHLGSDYFRDKHGYLCFAPRKYVINMVETYQRLFGQAPKEYTSPLEKGDHPELDDSEFLSLEDTKKYQSMIGALQWVIQIGRLDITTACMTMSSFRAQPRKGHLDRLKRIYGYLSKMRHAAIRVRTELPDLSDLPNVERDWSQTVYAGAEEEIPKDAPRPLGKPVIHTLYYDANLYHDMLSGKAVTAVIHFLNKTPVDWFSKKQATVETATYGSEFVAGRTATDQTVDIRLSLRYLGVPILGSSIGFGDNKSQVDSSSIPDGRLHRRHTMLAYHRVREASAAGIIQFYHVEGAINAADILSKHRGYQQVWPQLQPLLFWEGDTLDIPPRP